MVARARARMCVCVCVSLMRPNAMLRQPPQPYLALAESGAGAGASSTFFVGKSIFSGCLVAMRDTQPKRSNVSPCGGGWLNSAATASCAGFRERSPLR